MIYNLVKHLDRTRFQPFVGHVDFRRGDFIHEFSNLSVTPVDFRAGHLRNPLATAGVVWRIGRFIRRNRVDVVFTSGAHNHIYAALARKIVRVPIVTYVMNHYQPRLLDNAPIVRLALRLGADYYLAASRTCLEPLEQLIPEYIPREVMYHGVDLDFTSGPSNPAPVRDQLGLGDGQKLISVIGRLQRWKGQDVFLRAAALVALAYPEARFALVGGSLFGLEEDYAGELQSLIRELGLEGRCWLVGHRPDVRDWMAASDIVIHAARTPEPGANAVMEAMAMGRPVIASACGAPAEILEDGVSGLLFKPGDSEDLAAQILRLLQDSALAGVLGRVAAGRIKRAFTADHMAVQLSQVLERLLCSTPPLVETLDVKPRTIMFTLSSCRRAGVEGTFKDIIRVLDRTRSKPMAVFLCLSEEGSFPDELESMGADVIVRRIGRLRNPFNVLRTVVWLARLIRSKQVSLAFSYGHNHPYVRLAGLATECPIIRYETFLFKAPFWRNGPIYTLNFVLGTNAYLSTGQFASETIRNADPYALPVYYTPEVADLSTFDYRMDGAGFRKEMGIPEDGFVYAMVGRIQDWKGQDIFVEAAVKMARELSNVYFVIVGGAWFDNDKALEADLRRKVGEHGLKQRILFTGFLPDPVPAFAAANVICHCSKLPEPTGSVIVEAFAMKKPVISVNEGGPLELIRPDIDGWLVPPGNVGSLVDAMKRCLYQRDVLAKMGEAGYWKVISQHGESSFVKTLNDLIEQYAIKGK